MLRASGCARGSKPTGDKLTKPAFHGCLRCRLALLYLLRKRVQSMQISRIVMHC